MARMVELRSHRRNAALSLLLQLMAACSLRRQSFYVCEGLTTNGHPPSKSEAVQRISVQSSSQAGPPTPALRTNIANRQAFLSAILGGSVVMMATGAGALPATAAATPPAVVVVVAAKNEDPSVYNHEYADPLHPLCKRRIDVSPDGKTFHYSGTAVGPKNDDDDLAFNNDPRRGCSKDEIREYKLRFGSSNGIVLDDGRISAGDNNLHEGVWEPARSASTMLGYEDVDGIRWNDGNKWIVQEKPLSTKVGELITFSYIGFSLLAGGSELLKRALAKQDDS
jgi:hypothetical protein